MDAEKFASIDLPDGDDHDYTIHNDCANTRLIHDHVYSPRPSSSSFSSTEHHPDPDLPPPSGHRLRRNKTRFGTARAKVFTRARRAVGKMDFLCLPQKEEGSLWLAEEDRATEWLSLFFELAVVAVLSVFGGAHELTSPSAIPSFFGYYSIITWMWAWQVQYDVRYEANDIVHRVFKCLHIMLFIYIGAASAGWDLNVYTMFDPVEDTDPFEHVIFQQADTAFLTVALALIIQRVLLVIQYLMAAALGLYVGRPVAAPFSSAASLLFVALITVFAAAIPANSMPMIVAKIAMLYLSFVSETVISAVLVWRHVQMPARGQDLAERFGAFTLIIIGEGFLNLSRAFQKALSGESAGDATLYAQVFMVIVIMFNLWGFLFGNFHKHDNMSHKRGLLWEGIHFPLHFGILLFFASLVNVVVVTSFNNGLGDVLNLVSNAFTTGVLNLNDVDSHSAAGTVLHQTKLLSNADLNHIADYVNRLAVTPDFMTEYYYLQNLSSATGHHEQDANNVIGEMVSYLGQIVYSAAITAGVEIPEGAATALNELNAVNMTNQVTEETLEHGLELFAELTSDIMNDAFQGALWLFPTAGATLILTSLRSWMRYKFYGAEHYVLHLIPIVFGFVLILLVLLDIGPKSFIDPHHFWDHILSGDRYQGATAIYRLVDRTGAVAVVFAAYMLVAILTMGMNMYIRRRRRTRTLSASRESTLDSTTGSK